MTPIEKALIENKTIAIVGASNNSKRPVYEVAKYLQDQGYKIIPVNPSIDEFLGEKSFPDVLSIPGSVDIVDIFRAPDAVPEIVEHAIAKKARVVWMQPGAENSDAATRATDAGLDVIAGVCMLKEHRAMLERFNSVIRNSQFGDEMANVRTATVKWIGGADFQAETGSGHTFITSSNKSDGPSPVELVLVGLAGCTAIDVNDILKKKRLQVTGLDVRVEGTRAETYPKVYTDIQVVYTVRGKDIPARAVEQAIHLSEDKYCSVGAMLGKTAKITHHYEIIPE